MASTKPTKLERSFGISSDRTAEVSDIQSSLMDPVEDGNHEVMIRSASIFTKDEDGNEHENPTLGLMFNFDAYPGQRGVVYLQFRPRENAPEEEVAEAHRKFGIKVSALFAATGVNHKDTMTMTTWTAEEKEKGRKLITDMMGKHVRMTLTYNDRMNPRDRVSKGYHLSFVTMMAQPDDAKTDDSK